MDSTASRTVCRVGVLAGVITRVASVASATPRVAYYPVAHERTFADGRMEAL